ncbi:DNA repair protein RecN [Pigmentibacter ruber]|uniref:DNA repair protein RecN n=1 Tax=Pigmentibacter ruber TaxID=2683196 RepID=UPI00131B81D4|nr:DNA repair protein RecN [Pigmentibacter ruber]BFD30752.1 DNA repair protein RecN [Pigmentibacter ruber]
MLKQLHIQNLAIAENIAVNFKNSLNVITGETGAGKSLLVDAMSLLRGARVDTHLIRTGEESALITGIFSPQKNKLAIFNLLEEHGIPLFSDDPEEIIIKRYIQRNGKHKSTVNETLVSSKILQNIAAELIDISSQFENQKLLDTESHTYYLDEIANNLDVYKNYLSVYLLAHEKIKTIKSLIHEQNLLKREKNLYEFELSQINNANINPAEFKELDDIIATGKKSAVIKKNCYEVISNLSQNDPSCIDILKISKKTIEKIYRHSSNNDFANYLEQIDAIISLVEEFSHKLEVTSEKYTIEESNLNHAIERMDTYNKILQKFGPTIEDALIYKNKCEDFLNKTLTIDLEIEAEIFQCEEAIKKSINFAEILSKNRKNKLSLLTHSIEKELSELGMEKSKFICELKENNKINDFQELFAFIEKQTFKELITKFQQLSKFGFEKAQFLLSTNVGIEAQPIDKVASGGELSRIMLAIKNILFGNNSMSVFVFDEIDTGISGNIAAKVGKKLLEFCRGCNENMNRQAICITHLPQVACFAQNHFVVTKEFTNNRTSTKIFEASEEEKLKEIAILLSGEEVSAESIAQAKVLVQEAQRNLH